MCRDVADGRERKYVEELLWRDSGAAGNPGTGEPAEGVELVEMGIDKGAGIGVGIVGGWENVKCVEARKKV